MYVFTYYLLGSSAWFLLVFFFLLFFILQQRKKRQQTKSRIQAHRIIPPNAPALAAANISRLLLPLIVVGLLVLVMLTDGESLEDEEEKVYLVMTITEDKALFEFGDELIVVSEALDVSAEDVVKEL